MDLPTPPDGTHELFLVFVNPTAGGGDGLFNLNYFTALGKGAANSAAPEVTATAEPPSGDAPLQVQFTGTADDPDAEPGEELTYAWDFGVAGTSDDTSDELSPTYTYERPGTYLARFTATDPNGASATASVQVEVTSSRRVPAEQRQVRRVQRRFAGHQPVADHPAGQHAAADGRRAGTSTSRSTSARSMGLARQPGTSSSSRCPTGTSR